MGDWGRGEWRVDFGWGTLGAAGGGDKKPALERVVLMERIWIACPSRASSQRAMRPVFRAALFPGKFADCGRRMLERTSAKPMARRTRHRMCRITVRALCLSTKNKERAAMTWRTRIVRPIHGAHPFALRATGPALRAVQICSRQICRTGFESSPSQSKTKSPP